MLLQLNFSAAFIYPFFLTLLGAILLRIAAPTLSPSSRAPSATASSWVITSWWLRPEGGEKKKAKAGLLCILPVILPYIFRQERGYGYM